VSGPPSTDLSALAAATNLDANAILNMEEGLGYLKALGLDFGWGPSSVVQWTLEHFHVVAGLPWWASIVATAFAIRVLLWKPTMMSLDQGAKVAIWRQRPEVAEMQRQMVAMAAARAPTQEIMAVRQKFSASQREAGVKPLVAFLGLLHLPAGFAMWRVVSNMAALPVPSMEHGGILWFVDLTTPDPFYILPVVAPITMFAMLRVSYPLLSPSPLIQPPSLFPPLASCFMCFSSLLLHQCVSLPNDSRHQLLTDASSKTATPRPPNRPPSRSSPGCSARSPSSSPCASPPA
jgi:YidC/Oxa1 family membrane protein insertase